MSLLVTSYYFREGDSCCFLITALHTCLPPVAYKAGIGSHYAFQSAGGSPVLTVDFLRSLL